MYVCRYKAPAGLAHCQCHEFSLWPLFQADDTKNCNTPNMGGCYDANVVKATKTEAGHLLPILCLNWPSSQPRGRMPSPGLVGQPRP